MPADPDAMLGPDFDVVVADHGTTRTVTPVGDLDLETVDALQATLSRALSAGVETLVLDLAQTTFVDSTGIRLVLESQGHATRVAVRFVVLPGPPAVQRVFEICGLTELLPFAGPGGAPNGPGPPRR